MSKVKKAENVNRDELAGVMKLDQDDMLWEDLKTNYEDSSKLIADMSMISLNIANQYKDILNADKKILDLFMGYNKTIQDTAKELIDIKATHCVGDVFKEGKVNGEEEVMAHIDISHNYISLSEKILLLSSSSITDLSVAVSEAEMRLNGKSDIDVEGIVKTNNDLITKTGLMKEGAPAC